MIQYIHCRPIVTTVIHAFLVYSFAESIENDEPCLLGSDRHGVFRWGSGLKPLEMNRLDAWASAGFFFRREYNILVGKI